MVFIICLQLKLTRKARPRQGHKPPNRVDECGAISTALNASPVWVGCLDVTSKIAKGPLQAT